MTPFAGGVLPADEGGEGGTPVLFVHGLAGDRTHWKDQLRFLWRRRRAVAVDLPGHGDAGAADPGSYAIEAMAEAVRRTAASLGLERLVAVGHSLGASVVGALAGRRSELVAGLVLVDPSGDPSRLPRGEAERILAALASESYGSFVQRYFRRLLEGAAQEVRDRVLDSMSRTSREAVEGCWRANFSHDPVAALRAYPGPTLLVTAGFDAPPWSLRAALPHLPARTLTRTSHWLMMDRPDDFNEILESFLLTLEGRPV